MRLRPPGLPFDGPLWLGRRPGAQGLSWDMTRQDPPDDLPQGAILLHLAAVLPGRGVPQDNAEMARALVRADRLAGFRHVVFMSSVAVYGAQSGPIPETRMPAPTSDYGRAKLEAEAILSAGFGPRLTILRLANLAGADALLGGAGRTGPRAPDPVILDPVAGQPAGPVRSYIGPLTLVWCLTEVLGALAAGRHLPAILNLAQPGAISMGALLDAAGRDWRFGPPRDGVLARAEVDVTRLMAVTPLPPADPRAILAQIDALGGTWP